MAGYHVLRVTMNNYNFMIHGIGARLAVETRQR